MRNRRDPRFVIRPLVDTGRRRYCFTLVDSAGDLLCLSEPFDTIAEARRVIRMLKNCAGFAGVDVSEEPIA